jgi:hypothetical protein
MLYKLPKVTSTLGTIEIPKELLLHSLKGERTATRRLADQIALPTLNADYNKRDGVVATDFERLTRLQVFLLSLMLMSPVDPIYACGWNPMDWDRQLKEIQSMGYRLFIGVAGAGRRAVALVRADDLDIREQADRTRVYFLDLTDPSEAEQLTRNEDL